LSSRGLRQPDARSCGATVLVLARMRAEPAYDADVRPRFAEEVLATHRTLTGVRDPRGRLQVPWPLALGTPPWALARALSTVSTPLGRYRTRAAWPDRAGAFDGALAAVRAGRPVALYVGSRLLPRHVVLAYDEAGARLRCHEPAHGAVVDVDRSAWVAGRLRLAGWDVPWFVVAPA
jgi:hypothetical protein